MASGKGVVARRRVQLQRVVAASPDVADPGVGLDDPRVDPEPLQVVAGGEAGLAGADDEESVRIVVGLAVAVIGRSSLGGPSWVGGDRRTDRRERG